MKRKYYIAYGSNLNIEQMKHRCSQAVVIGRAYLNDYQLVFRGPNGGAVATIEKKEGEFVPVGIWQISESDESSLDKYEGWPLLQRKDTFEVKVNDETIEAMAYVMNEGRSLGGPSQEYLKTILRGYDDFNFYHDKIRLHDAADRDECLAGCLSYNDIRKYRIYLDKHVKGSVRSFEKVIVTDNLKARLDELERYGFEVTGYDEYLS